MKFGLIYNTAYHGTDPDQVIAVARHAEQCGFESFYVPEHIALYPGAAVGPAVFPASMPIADPLECLISSRRSPTTSCSAPVSCCFPTTTR